MLTSPFNRALVLTAREVAEVVTRLEGEACTARRVRYLLDGLLRTDTAPQPGRTRLYGPVEVALMRVAVRLEAQGVSAWVARVVLAYCGDDICGAWRARAAVTLAVRGVTGTIETEPSNPSAVARVALRSVRQGIENALRRQRRDHPHIWMWQQRSIASLAPEIA